jgi:hypothetical protein
VTAQYAVLPSDVGYDLEERAATVWMRRVARLDVVDAAEDESVELRSACSWHSLSCRPWSRCSSRRRPRLQRPETTLSYALRLDRNATRSLTDAVTTSRPIWST